MRIFARILFILYLLVFGVCVLISVVPQGGSYGLPWVIAAGIVGFPWSIIGVVILLLTGMSGQAADTLVGLICWAGAFTNLYFLGKWSQWTAPTSNSQGSD